MLKLKLKLIVLATLCFIIAINTACNDADITTQKDADNTLSSEFCQYVNNEDFESLKPIINDFLKEIEPNLDDAAKLQKLCDYLNKYDCVLNAEIFCVSCVKTLPPHSELKVQFKQNASSGMRSITLGLCIHMTEPLRVSQWHYPDDN